MAGVMPPYLRAAIVVLAGSGLRIGELLGLEVPDVDFKRGAIRIERQRLQSGLIGPPKTAKSRRTVPVGEVVTDTLLAHLAARPSKEWLFTMEEGEPLNYSRWKTEWKCARKALQKAENEAAEREERKPVELPHMVTHHGISLPPRSSRAQRASSRSSSSSATRPPSSRCGSTRTCGRVKKTAPDPPWTPCSAACGPGADRETLQPNKSQVRRRKDQAFLVSQKILSIWAM
nr:tyrosine-type recombinase/integrase [Streptomyces broussonetiae]